MEEETKLQANTVGRGITANLPEYNEVETNKTEPEKVTIMVGTFLNSECVRVSTIEMDSKKVAIMVGTFWNPESEKGPATKTEPEKVTIMVGTFWKDHNDDFQKISFMNKFKRVFCYKVLNLE